MRIIILTPEKLVRLLWLLVLLPVVAFSNGIETQIPNINSMSIAELEERLQSIDTTLEQLPRLSLRRGVGSIGYRSNHHGDADHTEWVEISLDKVYSIDEIALVPNISRYTERDFSSDGFPSKFRIIMGTTSDHTGGVVVEYDANNQISQRISPFIVPVRGVKASWVRIEATRLSLRSYDQRYCFQLAEVLIYSSSQNVALRQPVKVSSIHPDKVGAWSESAIVDGFTPYMMDSGQGDLSVAFVSSPGVKPALEVDLEQTYPLSEIILHVIDQSDTVPSAYSGDLGMPRHLRVEGANQEDFSDARILLEFQHEENNDTGPIMMWRIPETECRYVRVSDAESDPLNETDLSSFRIGFAEIELLSNGSNVALGKTVQSDVKLLPVSNRSLSALTDGHNIYGRILPIQTWLRQLSQRHDLEMIRPVIAQKLADRYARQKTNLWYMRWLAALLAGGILLTYLVDRRIRKREAIRMREQFAADLHDELGANLHTIGLLSDLAIAADDSPEKRTTINRRIRSETERSAIAVQHCSDMLTAEGLYTDLLTDMKRASNRIMAKLEHDISIEGREFLNRLKADTRANLFLFYKECLVNISRHSGATQFTTSIRADRKKITLQVSDNGRGLNASVKNGVPSSLKRRAKLLGAKISVGSPPSGGTLIELNLVPGRWRVFK